MFSPINALLKIAQILPAGSNRAAIAHVTILRSALLGVNICTGLITAALLGPEGRGELAALIIAPQVLAGLALLGLHDSLIYNIKADPQREREYIGITLLLTLSSGLIAIAIGWFLEPLWLGQYSSGIRHLARVFLVITPLATASYTFIAVLEARSCFILATLPTCLQSVCTLALLGIFVLAHTVTPASAAAAYILPYALSFCYLSVLVGYRVRPKLVLRVRLLMRLLRYGLRIYGDDVLGTVSPYLDQIVIAATLPPASLGVYAVGLSVSRLLNLLPASAATVLFPTLAARPAATITERIAAAVRVLTAINVAAALCIGLLGPHLIALFYGTKFASASGPLLVLLAESVVSNAVRLFYQAYIGSGRPGTVTIIQGIGFAASLGSMLLLVPAYGMIGAAVALLLSTLLRLGCVLVGLPLILGVRVPRLIISYSDLASMKVR